MANYFSSIALLPLFLFLLLPGTAFASCTGTPTADCDSYTQFQSETCVRGAAEHANGCDAVAPAYCQSVDAGTETSCECDATDSRILCYYSDVECQNSPCSTFDSNEALCRQAGCTWTDAQACSLGLGAACTVGAAAPACCSQGVCNQVTGACCMESGGSFACSDKSQCCSGLCDLGVTNRCVSCLNDGARGCSADSDCCGGLCEGGKCAAQQEGPSCGLSGSRCSGDADCCGWPEAPSDLSCDALNNPSAPTCRACASVGQQCGGSLGCCTGQCTNGACPQPKCEVKGLQDVIPVAGIAALGTLVLVALVYMGGEALQNARMSTWARTEAMQALVSVVVASVIIFAVYSLAGLTVAELSSAFGLKLPLAYKGLEGQNTYCSAVLYLENLGAVSLSNLAQLRYNLGAYEIRTSYTKYECDASCLLSFSSVNVAVFGGETVSLAITNNLLGTATVSYLTAVFQYFVLQYVLNGLFLIFLPIAIVMRSVPFMRQFGGALIGIFVALYALYPLMIVADAFLAPSLAKSLPSTLYERTGRSCEEAGTGVFGEYDAKTGSTEKYLNCASGARQEKDLDNAGTTETSMNELDDPPGSMTDLAGSVQLNILIFLAAVFLPAVNFIVIAALARDLTHFLGEEADISRLGQMV